MLGIRLSSVSKIPVRPVMVISSELNKNIATACSTVSPSSEVISSAAPGVDHAVTTGCLYRHESKIVDTPIPIPSAQNHEAICCWLAPALVAAWKMIAAALA